MKTKPFSLFLLLLTAAIWGFAFVAQVMGVNYVGSFTLNGIRFAVGTLALLPVALFFERGKTDRAERLRTLRASALAGIILFAATTLQQIGIELTGSAGVSGFITGLYTVFIPIVSYILWRERTTFSVWLGAVLAVLGLSLLCFKSGEGFSFGIGELFLLGGTFFWTAHLIVIGRMCQNVRPLHFSLGQFAVCSVLGLVTMFILEEPTLSGIFAAKWAILYCGIMSVGVAYTLQVIAQKNCTPTAAAIVFSCESLFSAIGGAIFGTDSISFVGYVGCALMFVGIIISQINFKGRKKSEKE